MRFIPKDFLFVFFKELPQALRKESECSETSRHAALSLLSHVLSLSNVLCFAGYVGLFLAPKDKDTVMELRDYEGTSEPWMMGPFQVWGICSRSEP